MSDQHNLALAAHCGYDRYTSSHARERALNAAIVQAKISESFERYLAIFDKYYADDIAVSSEAHEEPVRGKARVLALLSNFLVPLHVLAEVAGLSVSIRGTPMAGEAADETHSEWTLDMVGASGRTCSLSWRALRKWNRSRVVYEHHYDLQQNGEPLTLVDLSFDAAEPEAPSTIQ
jgi:hypothetical protein